MIPPSPPSPSSHPTIVVIETHCAKPPPRTQDGREMWSACCKDFLAQLRPRELSARLSYVEGNLFRFSLGITPAKRYMFARRGTRQLEDFLVFTILLRNTTSQDTRIRYLAYQYWAKFAKRMQCRHGQRKLLPSLCYTVENKLNKAIDDSSRSQSTNRPVGLAAALQPFSDLELLIGYYYSRHALRLRPTQMVEFENCLIARGFQNIRQISRLQPELFRAYVADGLKQACADYQREVREAMTAQPNSDRVPDQTTIPSHFPGLYPIIILDPSGLLNERQTGKNGGDGDSVKTDENTLLYIPRRYVRMPDRRRKRVLSEVDHDELPKKQPQKKRRPLNKEMRAAPLASDDSSVPRPKTPVRRRKSWDKNHPERYQPSSDSGSEKS